MKVKAFSLAILLLTLALFGCALTEKKQEPSKTAIFTSQDYSFSFSYPTQWQEVTKDLPDRWAITDANGDVILFTVNPAPIKDINLLGNLQALRDIYQVNDPESVSKDDLDAVSKIIKIKQFAEGSDEWWYTYAIDSPSTHKQNFISGTLCADKEITIVFVGEVSTAQQKTSTYSSILESFSCNA